MVFIGPLQNRPSTLYIITCLYMLIQSGLCSLLPAVLVVLYTMYIILCCLHNIMYMTKARSALAHKIGLKLDPLDNCLLSDGLKDCSVIGVKLAWMWISCSSAERALRY